MRDLVATGVRISVAVEGMGKAPRQFYRWMEHQPDEVQLEWETHKAKYGIRSHKAHLVETAYPETIVNGRADPRFAALAKKCLRDQGRKDRNTRKHGKVGDKEITPVHPNYAGPALTPALFETVINMLFEGETVTSSLKKVGVSGVRWHKWLKQQTAHMIETWNRAVKLKTRVQFQAIGEAAVETVATHIEEGNERVAMWWTDRTIFKPQTGVNVQTTIIPYWRNGGEPLPQAAPVIEAEMVAGSGNENENGSMPTLDEVVDIDLPDMVSMDEGNAEPTMAVTVSEGSEVPRSKGAFTQ